MTLQAVAVKTVGPVPLLPNCSEGCWTGSAHRSSQYQYGAAPFSHETDSARRMLLRAAYGNARRGAARLTGATASLSLEQI